MLTVHKNGFIKGSPCYFTPDESDHIQGCRDPGSLNGSTQAQAATLVTVTYQQLVPTLKKCVLEFHFNSTNFHIFHASFGFTVWC